MTPEATTTTTTKPTTPAPKSPEQQAREMRAQAKALRALVAANPEDKKTNAKLTTRAEQLESDADQIAPRKAKASSEPRPQCTRTKKDGTPCTARCMEDKDHCTDHRPAVEHLKAHEVQRVAEWLQQATVEALVEMVGWGQVRQALKDGRIA